MANEPQILESPDDVLSTLHKDGKRRWLYPVLSRGRFLRSRRVVAWALMGLFVALPIIQIGGKPAILLDVMAREFTFFGLTLYPTDTLLLMIFLLTVLVSVFLFTALFGRVWCGWACPQTVYLEFVFRPVERLVEGKASARRRRDESEATPGRLVRKAVKWLIYGVIAVALAHVFVAYFVGWERLLAWMGGSPTEHWGFFVLMGGTSALILFDFGFFREQMCTIACPYARFQSVLQDRDSLIVSYDPARGEPRGRRTRDQRKKETEQIAIGLGDCIDCGACVRTCPTGIDIRQGLQMECVGCTQCIDACDAIMDGIAKPRGLIRYTSENEIEGQESKIVRPRVIAYSVLLVGLLVAFTTVLSMRTPIEVNVGRTVGAPFTLLPDGQVTNRLRFRVQNRTGKDASYTVEAVEPSGLELKMVGRPQLDVAAGATGRVEAWVVAPAAVFRDGESLATFKVSSDEDHQTTAEFLLLGPEKQ